MMQTVTTAQLRKLNQLQNSDPALFSAVLTALTHAVKPSGMGDFWSDFQNLASTYLQYRVLTNSPSTTPVSTATTQQQLAAAGVGVSNTGTYILIGTAAVVGIIAVIAFAKRKK